MISRENNAIIVNKYTKVYGEHCIVQGDYCEIYGDHCIVQGNYCNIYGNYALITGNHAMIYGHLCKNKGKNNRKITRINSGFVPTKITIFENKEKDEKLNVEKLLTVQDIQSDKNCCVICNVNKKRVVFGCGHICLCRECTINLINNYDKPCPLCNKAITNVMSVYVD